MTTSEFGTDNDDGIPTDVLPPGQRVNDDDAVGEHIKQLDVLVTAVDAFVTGVGQGMRCVGRYEMCGDSLAVNDDVMHETDFVK